jgi:hypothetical protein
MKILACLFLFITLIPLWALYAVSIMMIDKTKFTVYEIHWKIFSFVILFLGFNITFTMFRVLFNL